MIGKTRNGRKIVFLPLTPLTLVLLLHVLVHHSLGDTSGDNLIRWSCKRAADGDPNIHYDFCVMFFEDDNAQSKSATTLQELMFISVNFSVLNATNIESRITGLLKSKRFDQFTRECLRTCSDVYSDASSTLEGVANDLESEDYMKANMDISAAMDDSVTCEDGFKERTGVVSPLTKENDAFFQLTAISLAFVNMLR